MPFRTPRTQAEKYDDRSKFDGSAQSYDAEAGTPPGVATRRGGEDYNSNPTNPPEKPAPASGLKG